MEIFYGRASGWEVNEQRETGGRRRRTDDGASPGSPDPSGLGGFGIRVLGMSQREPGNQGCDDKERFHSEVVQGFIQPETGTLEKKSV